MGSADYGGQPFRARRKLLSRVKFSRNNRTPGGF
jgi:hypothetical protein